MDAKRVEHADVKPACAAMARAFFDDPIYAWAFPDERTRMRRMVKMNQAMIPRLMRVSHLELYTTHDHAGLAIWGGPEHWEAPNSAMLPAVPKLLRAMGLSGTRKFFSLMAALKAAHPKEPHWYLMGLGTDPPKQRTGVGATLVRQVLDRCDEFRLPAYLETQKAENVPYYERFGFQVTGEIDPPMGAPHMWLMWRQA